MNDIEELRAALKTEKILRVKAEIMALESNIIASQFQRIDLIRQLKELENVSH